MKTPKAKKEDEDAYTWRKGFEDGMRTAMDQNSVALKLGNAILEALDNRYEFAEKDY